MMTKTKRSLTMEKYFGIKPFGATPNQRQLNHYAKMYKKAFFHFGVNTFSNLEWGDGTEAEKMFDPTDLDVRSWIRDIKAAGFQLAMMTVKHHDGFCLWPSKYTEHSVKNSPYKDGKGDVVREFVDACREYNVKVGIYISPWDRNSEYWGTDQYSLYYAKQLEELCTEYGPLDEVWWDGAGSGETPYDWGNWAYIVRNNQPDAVLFGSIGATPYIDVRWCGNESGYAGETHYASTDEESISTLHPTFMTRIRNNTGIIGGERYIPAEVDVSIRPGWFYHADQDDKVKSARELDKIWFRSVGQNALMLLNFPPDTTGHLPRQDVLNAIESNNRINKMLSVNHAINATVTADSAYCRDTGIDKAVLDDDGLFWASAEGKDSAVIDILLDDNAPEINVLKIGEMVELGERITSFKLESLDGDEPAVLLDCTSVGYLRAERFRTGKYKRLRLTLNAIEAPVTLRVLALHTYDEDNEEEARLAALAKRENLAAMASSKISYSEDGLTATINFGGIYPFDTVSFNMQYQGEYRISAFDGANFYEIASGWCGDYVLDLNLGRVIDSSYQIQIWSKTGFRDEPKFKVL